MVPGDGGRPTICLNMIVKNESHVLEELVAAVAPYIHYWVVVDTGSTDGTQDLLRDLMARRGIPGELHERPWRDFGHNRSEAMALARGHCDYVWVMDADDTVVGTPDFTRLTADAYTMRIDDGVVYWRLQLFRDGLPWYYKGVLHELAACDEPFGQERLEGDYRVMSRRIGGRNLDPDKYLRDAEVLLAENERNPGNPRTVFYLAQSYYCYGDYENSRKWDQLRADMGGWEEEVYYSLFRVAEAAARLNDPWPKVLEAYLHAWNYRPTRAEALHAVARHCRIAGRYPMGHLFAERAAQLPLPEDVLFVNAEIHQWRAMDEQAVCASWIGRPAEAFDVSRRLVSIAQVPENDRQRIEANRDLMARRLLDRAIVYPDVIPSAAPGGSSPQVTLTLVVGADRVVAEQTINSFLRTCSDIGRVDRFLALDVGLTASDRAVLSALYPFLEFADGASVAGDRTGQIQQLKERVTGRYWLHLGEGWRFFAPDPLISRLAGVLDAEPAVFQVGVNFEDAETFIGRCAEEQQVRRTRDGRRYVMTNAVVNGPAMFDIGRADYAWSKWRPGDPVHTATLDEVLCVQRT